MPLPPRAVVRGQREMRKRLVMEIRGLVQGVWFRARTRETARRLGVTGKVWNNPDGSVGVIAEGEENRLRELLAWCRRGPEAARVDEVRCDWQEFTGEFAAFTISYA